MNNFIRIRCAECGATKDTLLNQTDIHTIKCVCGKINTFKILGYLSKVIYKDFVKT